MVPDGDLAYNTVTDVPQSQTVVLKAWMPHNQFSVSIQGENEGEPSPEERGVLLVAGGWWLVGGGGFGSDVSQSRCLHKRTTILSMSFCRHVPFDITT